MQKRFESLGSALGLMALGIISILVITLFTSPIWLFLFQSPVEAWWVGQKQWSMWVLVALTCIVHVVAGGWSAGYTKDISREQFADEFGQSWYDLIYAIGWVFAREAYLVGIAALVAIAASALYGVVLIWIQLNELWGPVVASIPTGMPPLVALSFGLKFKMQFGHWPTIDADEPKKNGRRQ